MKRKKRISTSNPYFLPIIIFLSMILLAAVGFRIAASFIKIKEPPALSLQDFLIAEDIQVKDNNILLATNCYRLAMVTSLEQTESIAKALQNITSKRPNAHDLFAYSIKNFNISPLFVKIHSFRDGTYYAALFLKEDNKILALDARPSDAIAIALRLRSPVYLNKNLLAYAEKIC